MVLEANATVAGEEAAYAVAEEAGAEEERDRESEALSTATPTGANSSSSSSEEWTASGRRWRSRALTPPPGSWVLPQTRQVPQRELELLPTYFVLLEEAKEASDGVATDQLASEPGQLWCGQARVS